MKHFKSHSTQITMTQMLNCPNCDAKHISILEPNLTSNRQYNAAELQKEMLLNLSLCIERNKKKINRTREVQVRKEESKLQFPIFERIKLEQLEKTFIGNEKQGKENKFESVIFEMGQVDHSLLSQFRLRAPNYGGVPAVNCVTQLFWNVPLFQQFMGSAIDLMEEYPVLKAQHREVDSILGVFKQSASQGYGPVPTIDFNRIGDIDRRIDFESFFILILKKIHALLSESKDVNQGCFRSRQKLPGLNYNKDDLEDGCAMHKQLLAITGRRTNSEANQKDIIDEHDWRGSFIMDLDETVVQYVLNMSEGDLKQSEQDYQASLKESMMLSMNWGSKSQFQGVRSMSLVNFSALFKSKSYQHRLIFAPFPTLLVLKLTNSHLAANDTRKMERLMALLPTEVYLQELFYEQKFNYDEDIPPYCLRAIICKKRDETDIIFIRVVIGPRTVWRLYNNDEQIEQFETISHVLEVLKRTNTLPTYCLYEQAEYLEIVNHDDISKEQLSSEVICSQIIRDGNQIQMPIAPSKFLLRHSPQKKKKKKKRHQKSPGSRDNQTMNFLKPPNTSAEVNYMAIPEQNLAFNYSPPSSLQSNLNSPEEEAYYLNSANSNLPRSPAQQQQQPTSNPSSLASAPSYDQPQGVPQSSQYPQPPQLMQQSMSPPMPQPIHQAMPQSMHQSPYSSMPPTAYPASSQPQQVQSSANPQGRQGAYTQQYYPPPPKPQLHTPPQPDEQNQAAPYIQRKGSYQQNPFASPGSMPTPPMPQQQHLPPQQHLSYQQQARPKQQQSPQHQVPPQQQLLQQPLQPQPAQYRLQQPPQPAQEQNSYYHQQPPAYMQPQQPQQPQQFQPPQQPQQLQQAFTGSPRSSPYPVNSHPYRGSPPKPVAPSNPDPPKRGGY